LTGHTYERMLMILWGEGHNGKSTLCDLMAEILGPKLFTPCGKETFMKGDRAQQANAASPQLVRLNGARVVVMSETNKNESLNESLVKSITGGDPISVRQLHGQQFEFTPTFKLLLPTNHKPSLNSEDGAMRDRVRFLPFFAQFVDREPVPTNPHERKRDPTFASALRTTHLNEIFTWVVQGCQRWYKEKLSQVPKRMLSAKQDYLNEMDTVANFLEDCCIQEPDLHCSSSDLYGAYQQWCARNQERKLSLKDFGVSLKVRFECRKTNGGRMTYFKIGLSNAINIGF
jgi:putative DNA primase/helicase